jgi:hypothetical protein
MSTSRDFDEGFMAARPWTKYLTDRERVAIKLLDKRIAKASGA